MGLSDTLAARFDVESHGSDVRTELVAGLTTFLAMSYIIVVNPRSSRTRSRSRGTDRARCSR